MNLPLAAGGKAASGAAFRAEQSCRLYPRPSHGAGPPRVDAEPRAPRIATWIRPLTDAPGDS